MSTKFNLCPTSPRPSGVLLWEIHVGTIHLFIVGPGERTMLRVSEPHYSGPVGTPEEIKIARHAVILLNRDHGQSKDGSVALIRQAMERATREVRAGISHSPASAMPYALSGPEPTAPPVEDPGFEIVAEETMKWKCTACRAVFQGPLNRPPRGGCPACGSAKVFDCNAVPLPSKPLPAPAAEPIRKRAPYRVRSETLPDTAAILAVVRAVANVAGVRLADVVNYGRTREICYARHLAMATVHQEFPGLVLDQVGEIFSRGDSVVRHSYQAHASLMRAEPDYQKMHARLQAELHATA